MCKCSCAPNVDSIRDKFIDETPEVILRLEGIMEALKGYGVTKDKLRYMEELKSTLISFATELQEQLNDEELTLQ